jgi:hypothetical protein
LANFCVAIFAVETGCYMRAMAVIDKVGEQRDGYPGDLLIPVDVRLQLVQFRAGFGDLLMAAIAFGYGWQTRRLPSQGSRVAIKARNSKANVLVVRKLDGLRKLELSLTDSEDRTPQYKKEDNSQPYLNKRLF